MNTQENRTDFAQKHIENIQELLSKGKQEKKEGRLDEAIILFRRAYAEYQAASSYSKQNEALEIKIKQKLFLTRLVRNAALYLDCDFEELKNKAPFIRNIKELCVGDSVPLLEFQRNLSQDLSRAENCFIQANILQLLNKRKEAMRAYQALADIFAGEQSEAQASRCRQKAEKLAAKLSFSSPVQGLALMLNLPLGEHFTANELLSSENLSEKLREASKKGIFEKFDINQELFEQKNLLFLAIELGFIKVVEALLEIGVSIHLSYKWKTTHSYLSFSPLFWAVIHGERECFDLLISRAQTMLQEDSQEIGNILHAAIQFGQLDMLDHLLNNHWDKTKRLLEKMNAKGQTPLMLAASLGDIYAMALLLDKGADLETKSALDYTALHAAAMENQNDAIRFLIYAGANHLSLSIQKEKPIDLVQDEEIRLFLLKTRSEMQGSEPPRSFFPYESLVFEGGFFSGDVYTGFLFALEAHRAAQRIKRVAGLSGQGAILATSFALNCSITEIFPDLDINSEAENWLSTSYESLSKELIDLMEKFERMKTTLLSPMELFKFFKPFWLCKDSFDITSLRHSIDLLIFQKTGISNCTFGELKALVEKREKGFKHLHLFGAQLVPSSDQAQLVSFNSEDEASHSLIISDTVIISMILPGFQPARLYEKNPETQERQLKEEENVYVSPDLFCPSPTKLFDTKQYVFQFFSKDEEDCPCYNSRTLNLGFYIPKENFPLDNEKIRSGEDLFMQIIAFYFYAKAQLPCYDYAKEEHRQIQAQVDLKRIEHDKVLVGMAQTEAERFLKEESVRRFACFEGILEKKNKSFSLLPPLPDFQERKELLDFLKVALLPDEGWTSETKVKPIVLYGEEGTGKTEAARFFAHQHLDDYCFIYLINSETPEMRRSGYRHLAKEVFHISWEQKTSDQQVEEILFDHLKNHRSNKPWLLIYDGVKEKFPLPPFGGFILLTSKEKQWISNYTVRSFTMEEAVAFLKRSTGLRDETKLENWAQRVGCLPIGLRQVATYLVHENECGEIAELGQKEKVRSSSSVNVQALIQKHEKLSNPDFSPLRIKKAITELIERILNALQSKCPEALNWLHVCSYFHAKDIPSDWIFDWLNLINPTFQRSHYPLSKKILRLLIDYSLIRYNVKAREFSLHPAIQEAVKNIRQGKDGNSMIEKGEQPLVRCDFYDQALQLILRKGEHIPQKRIISRKEFAWFFHAIHLLRHPLLKISFPHQQAELSFYVGVFFDIFNNPKEAIEAYQRTVKMTASTDLKATCLNFIGIDLLNEGQLEESKSCFLGALELSPPSIQLAISHENLGHFFYALENYEEALKCFQAAYAIRLENSSSSSLATSLMNIARVYMKQGRYKEAKEDFFKVSEMIPSHPELSHLELATAFEGLANAEFSLENYEQAKNHYQNVLKLRYEVYSSDANSESARLFTQLATSFFMLDQYEEAKKAYLQAYEMYKELNQANSETAARVLINLGIILRIQGKYEESKDAHQKAHRLFEEIYKEGTVHPDIANSLENLSLCELSLGRSEQGMVYAEQALHMLYTIHGNINHSHIASALLTLSRAYLIQGDYEAAKKYAEEALEMHKKVQEKPIEGIWLWVDPLETAKSIHQLGDIAMKMGNYVEALNYYNEELSILNTKNKNARFVAACLNSQGEAYSSLGNISEASQRFENALKLYREIFPNEDHPEIQKVLANQIKLSKESLGKSSEWQRCSIM